MERFALHRTASLSRTGQLATAIADLPAVSRSLEYMPRMRHRRGAANAAMSSAGERHTTSLGDSATLASAASAEERAVHAISAADGLLVDEDAREGGDRSQAMLAPELIEPQYSARWLPDQQRGLPSWCAELPLRAVLWLSGYHVCAALAGRGGKHGSRWYRWCVGVAGVPWLAVLLACMLWRERHRLDVIANSSSGALAFAVAHSVLIVTTPALLLGGWYMAVTGNLPPWLPRPAAGLEEVDAEGQDVGADDAEQAHAAIRTEGSAGKVRAVPLVRALPRAVLMWLGVGFLVVCTTSAWCALLANQAYRMSEMATEEEVGDLQWMMWNLTRVLYMASPLFAMAAALSASALYSARRMHAVAQQLPDWPTQRVESTLRREETRLALSLNSLPVSLAITVLALDLVVFLCVVTHLATGGSARTEVFALIVMLESIADAVPPTVALYCAAEVTGGWMAVLRMLFVMPSGVDVDRLALAKHADVTWLHGKMGLRVFGVGLSKTLVLQGLWPAGTLLGMLLQFRRGGASSANE